MKIVDPTVVPVWNSLLGSQPEQTFFHSASWTAVLKETYGHQPLYLISDARDGSASLWPIMEVSSPLTGRRGVSLPFTDECAPIVDSRRTANQLFEAACELGRSRGWRYFEFRGGRFHIPGANASVTFRTHVLALKEDIDSVLSGFDGAVRRAIRKSIHSGVCTEISRSRRAVKTFFDLHCGTRRKHGSPPQPVSFFENIYKHVIAEDKGFVATAFHENKPVAAGIFFHSGDKAIYKFGASNEAVQHLRGNNLMMWAAIQHCLLLGCRSLHLGRTSYSNEGLRRYKLGWGAEEQVLEYFRFDLKKKTFVTSIDHASGWHNSFFRRIPISVSRGIGSVLYRHLA